MLRTLDYRLLSEHDVPQLGLIVLQSDVTLEDEFRHYLGESAVSLLCNRIPFENEVNAGTLSRMEHHLERTMSLFPIGTRFDTLGYACTSGALHIGSERIAELVRRERECTAVTDPLRAAIEALRFLGAERIACLTPYSVAVSTTMIENFRSNDIDVVAAATFDESQDRRVGRIDPECIQTSAIALCEASGRDDIDGVFIACTNLKAACVIPAIETALGIPVLSSNLALAWHMARLAGHALVPGATGAPLEPGEHGDTRDLPRLLR